MTEAEFFPYHNKHIVFKLANGQELSGVLTDPMNFHETGKAPTIYNFIPTRNMIAWKNAERERNQEKMRSLESEIDLRDIIWVERLNY